MKIKVSVLFACVACYFSLLAAEPPREIPAPLIQEFTLRGRIPISSWYMNESYPPTKPIVYTKKKINANLKLIAKKHQYYYGVTDLDLYAALKKYQSKIRNKRVAIIGSTTPWYESIAIYYGARPTTIEYNTITSKDPRLKTMTVAEYEKNPIKFDAIISISSIEHDGLGRYGDPINPVGDLKAMRTMKSMLKDDGILLLAIPTGKDRVVWNAHRIYGKIRFPMLLKGWEIIESFRFSPQDFEKDLGIDCWKHQPVFVLQPKRK